MALTPKQSVVAECRDCLGDYQIDCLSDICYLAQNLRYMDRIRSHCAHCSPNWNVYSCEMGECYLFPFRLGKNPNRVAAGKRKSDSIKEYQY